MKHILFVDDEQSVLDGLRRQLRSMRKEWQMEFCISGDSALAHLESNPCDVIVTDMRMPGMTGVQLLNEVKKRFSNVVRIALSGYADSEMLLESAGNTHQFLAKPCETEDLREAIDRAVRISELLDKSDLRALVSGVDTLPSLPELYQEIMRELSQPESSMQKVGEIIEQDVAMTAKMLQLVNSAFFGLPQHVSSPGQAATLLGVNIIRSLVLSTKVFDQCRDGIAGVGIEELWDHSMQVGAMARAVAQASGQDRRAADHAFLAGVLHDIGKLVLGSCFPKDYQATYTVVEETGKSLCEAELEQFGCTHQEVGAYLLGIWGLPSPIVEAVAFHHHPSDAVTESFSPLTAVHVANAIAHNREAVATDSGLLDQKYLDRSGLAGQVEGWLAACDVLQADVTA